MEQWLPTIVTGAMLTAAMSIIVWYIRSTHARIRLEVDKLTDRLKDDEDKYLTETKHQIICSGNTAEVKLHINGVMQRQREDLDQHFKDVWKRLDELRDLIKNGNH